MGLIKDQLENESKIMTNLVLNIKRNCEQYLENGNGANLNYIIDRTEDLKISRARREAFYYANNVEKVLETKLEERKEEK